MQDHNHDHSAGGLEHHGASCSELMSPELANALYSVNVSIGIAYGIISFALTFLAVKYWPVLGNYFKSYLLGFAAFIVLCGLSHFTYAQEIYSGDFELLYKVDLITALISGFIAAYTVIGVAYIYYNVQGSGVKVKALTQMRSALVLMGLAQLDADKRIKDGYKPQSGSPDVPMSALKQAEKGVKYSFDNDGGQYWLESVHGDLYIFGTEINEGSGFSPHKHKDTWEYVRVVEGILYSPIVFKKHFAPGADVLIEPGQTHAMSSPMGSGCYLVVGFKDGGGVFTSKELRILNNYKLNENI